jgi:RNA polymerase sigma factor (sigma-70 family)
MMETMTTIPPFERFYGEHCNEVLGYLRRLLGARAEDAWQETFLRALRAYDRLEHGRHLRAWVFTIATRVAMDDLRSKARTTRVPRAGASDRRAAPDRARRRRAPVRLRPSLRRDRLRTRFVRGRGTGRGIVRRSQTEEEP